MPKYSIIVPVYNTEKYLKQCIDSLQNQSFDDFEVLLIDDCSTDSSCSICQEICGKDNRFILIRQLKNMGLSAVRNKGIDSANGEYILFVDSDDYVEQDLLKKIDDLLYHKSYDLVLWGMYYDVIKKSGDVSIEPSPLNPQKSREISQPSSTDWKDVVLNTFFASSCNKVYRREIVLQNHIRFDELCVDFEDFIFNINYAVYVQNIMVLTDMFYHYHIPEGQIAPLKRKWGQVKRFEVSQKVFDAVEHFLLQMNGSDRVLDELMLYVYKAYNNEMEYMYRTGNREEFRREVGKLATDEKYYRMLEYLSSGKLKKVTLPVRVMLRMKCKTMLVSFQWYLQKRSI